MTTTTFFRMTKEIARELVSANLSAAEWRVTIALLVFNPWRSESPLPDIREFAQVSTSSLYRALNKVKKLGWFDFRLSVAYQNLLARGGNSDRIIMEATQDNMEEPQSDRITTQQGDRITNGTNEDIQHVTRPPAPAPSINTQSVMTEDGMTEDEARPPAPSASTTTTNGARPPAPAASTLYSLIPKIDNPIPKIENPIPNPENPIPRIGNPPTPPILKTENFIPRIENLIPRTENPILNSDNPIPNSGNAKTPEPIRYIDSGNPLKIKIKDSSDSSDGNEDLNRSEVKEKARVANNFLEFQEAIGAHAWLKFTSHVRIEHPAIQDFNAYMSKAWRDLAYKWAETIPVITYPQPTLEELKRLYPKSWEKAAKHFGY